ncbi:MAG TPA: hypothetical protein VII51_00005, partial [Gaiellaceae bacterium]
MVRRSRGGLGFCLGALAGAAVAALVSIAIDTGYEAQTLAGGVHLRDKAILIIVALAAFAVGLIGAAFGAESG